MKHENFVRKWDSLVTEKLAETWGGRTPTWREFKLAHDRGVVRVNHSLALNLFWDVGIPKFRALCWGFIFPLVGALIILCAPVALHILLKVGYWQIPVIWIAGYWFLFKVVREAACELVEDAAARNERVYTGLVNRGGFLFGPVGPIDVPDLRREESKQLKYFGDPLPLVPPEVDYSPGKGDMDLVPWAYRIHGDPLSCNPVDWIQRDKALKIAREHYVHPYEIKTPQLTSDQIKAAVNQIASEREAFVE